MLIIVINFSELNNKNVTDELLVWSIRMPPFSSGWGLEDNPIYHH